MTQVVLASASPRRRELLQLLLASFECCPVHIDETPLEGERPAIYVERLAREKSLACPERRRPGFGGGYDRHARWRDFG
jgi:septum formation protein